MSIVEIVDHPYRVRTQGDTIEVSFQTSRAAWSFVVIFMLWVCAGLCWIGLRADWNGNFLAALIGGCFSTMLITCFAAADHITRYRLRVDRDIVSLQREFEGIPVTRQRLYSRALITDLGIYPNEARYSPPGRRSGTLCLWIHGSSIELERNFPIAEGVSLARDLRTHGVAFGKTQPPYIEGHLDRGTESIYVTF